MAKKNKKSGLELFESFYGDVYGDRWETLKSALVKPKEHVAYVNHMAKDLADFSDCQKDPHFPDTFHGSTLPEVIYEEGKASHYLLDYASVIAAKALMVEPGMDVLDLCAAPGGKSIILGQALQSGSLTLNDRSQKRRERLKKVTDSFLSDFSELDLKIYGHDAKAWGVHYPNSYDRVLLDAPCSSERHLLEDTQPGAPEQLTEWKEGRTKRLSKDQFTMIASAFDSLREGGRMVYSTCSISPLENDDVIAKLLKKRDAKVCHKFTEQLGLGEKTEYGTIMLPDKSDWGPIYFSVILK
ncbi:MAG: RsmB/NOP family class I SAM-dependent RNA methyltransferase [Oligoflexia bacterium]|nr:RsmB/NOP family class I SAM-dependent RNA methyltransferase [Oligoflexia bacterium]